jgi:uncharacterized SAM-binding protein YcdF (DUF218 family)
MFFILKIISTFILPPGVFVIISGLVLLCVILKRRKAMIISLFLLVLLLYLSSIEPVKDALLTPLENSYAPFSGSVPENAVSPEYIVVLGGGIIDSSPDEEGLSSPPPGVMKRLYEAYKVYETTRLPVIVSGGRVFKDKNCGF